MSGIKSNSNHARRKLLKGIAAGSGAVIAGKSLPDSWSRPMVDSVMLPAHAQTSFVGRSFTNQMVVGRTPIEPDSPFASALGGLVNQAHAGPPTPPIMAMQTSCIRENADGTVRVDAVIDMNYINVAVFTAPSVPVDGTQVPMQGSPCGLIIIGPVPDASLIDPLGLVPDAHAGLGFTNSVQVQVDTINGSAVGRYWISRVDLPPGELPFDLPVGECSPPVCPVPI